jgi:hypothetical protein
LTAYVPREGPPGPPGPPGDLSAALFDQKGDLLAGTGPDAVNRHGAGPTGYFLRANSATLTGLDWAVAMSPTLFDAKGDLLVGVDNDVGMRQGLGPTDSVLTSDIGQVTGVKWVKVGDSMVLAGSNLAKLAAVTGAPNGTKFLRDDGSWQVPGASAITIASAVLAADTPGPGTNATWLDALTLALAAGTWIVVCTALATQSSGGGGTMAYRLWDGTNTFNTFDSPGTVTTSAPFSATLSAIVVAASAITLRLALWDSRNGSTVKAAGVNAPSGNNATQINAIKTA